MKNARHQGVGGIAVFAPGSARVYRLSREILCLLSSLLELDSGVEHESKYMHYVASHSAYAM